MRQWCICCQLLQLYSFQKTDGTPDGQVTSLLDDYVPFQSFTRHGLEAVLKYFLGADMSGELSEWAFNLCKTNMAVRRPLGCPIYAATC